MAENIYQDIIGIDASVPEFADQYQYQYQYQKNYWVQYQCQYQYSPNTDSTSTSTSTTNIEWKRREISIFWEKNQFSCGKFKFCRAILNFLSLKFQFEKKNMTCFGKLRCRQFFAWFFAFFFVLVLVLIDSVLAWSVPVQSQYLKTVPVPVPVHQYQKWSMDWKNQYQYQWTDSSIIVSIPHLSFRLILAHFVLHIQIDTQLESTNFPSALYPIVSKLADSDISKKFIIKRPRHSNMIILRFIFLVEKPFIELSIFESKTSQSNIMHFQ